MKPWTPEDIETLGRHIDKGLSGSEAALPMRRTRNSVLGKAQRLLWHFGRPRTEQEKVFPSYSAEARRAIRNIAPRDRATKKAGHAVCITFDDETYLEIVRRAKADRDPHCSRAQIVRELVEWGLEAGLP